MRLLSKRRPNGCGERAEFASWLGAGPSQPSLLPQTTCGNPPGHHQRRQCPSGYGVAGTKVLAAADPVFRPTGWTAATPQGASAPAPSVGQDTTGRSAAEQPHPTPPFRSCVTEPAPHSGAALRKNGEGTASSTVGDGRRLRHRPRLQQPRYCQPVCHRPRYCCCCCCCS
jgi:hypothetical protein